MSGSIQNINIDKIVNYHNNPRHIKGNNEKDTLKKLFDSVGIQYMLNLAWDIHKNGLLQNQQIVVVYFDELNKFVVYEGNRRIAVLKMLLDPEYFDFLDKSTRDKIKELKIDPSFYKTLRCYVTDEKEALFIMERTHSGEDKGRGVKQWNAREKEEFKVRNSNIKSLSYLIDFYCKKYFDGFDITSILPFTTLKRIFDPRQIKKKIGLNMTDESSFTKERMELVIEASRWIVNSAKEKGEAVTRLYNKTRDIEDALLPWIDLYLAGNVHAQYSPKNLSVKDKQSERLQDEYMPFHDGNIHEVKGENSLLAEKINTVDKGDACWDTGRQNLDHSGEVKSKNSSSVNSSGSAKNLPYFFQGINYENLDPNDVDSHGIAAVCRELHLFSERRMVDKFPLASAFLTRSVIEQSIIYYSKKHKIQGQDKYIWSNIENLTKLSKIITNYKKNLSNYIKDSEMRQYFKSLFDDYEKNIDPLNWVVHRTSAYKIDAETLIHLPHKGLLVLINYLIN